jgi:hypothetical protein
MNRLIPSQRTILLLVVMAAAVLVPAGAQTREKAAPSAGAGIPRLGVAASEIPPVPLFVDANAGPGRPDGTLQKPFKTIRSALDFAAGKKYAGLILFVFPGNYEEGKITLRFNVSIKSFLARGGPRLQNPPALLRTTILNKGGFTLAVDSFTLDQSSLTVAHGRAVTVIKDSLFENGTDFAIRQAGGKIKIENCTFRKTARRATDIADAGTALILEQGTVGTLASVTFQDNENGALAVSGDNTRVYARNVTASGNRSGPGVMAYENGAGTVEVRDGALLLMENGLISDNGFLGLFVHNGGRAHIRDSLCEKTRSVTVNGSPLGGSNIVVKQTRAALAHGQAALQLTDVVTSGAALCGVQVIDGLFATSAGSVTGNAIGANIQSPEGIIPQSRVACFGDTRFSGNGTNLDSANLPVPDPLGNGSQNPAGCASVPFECTWCEGE